MRAQIEKKMAQKEKEQKETELRALAQKARDQRAGIRATGVGELCSCLSLCKFFLSYCGLAQPLACSFAALGVCNCVGVVPGACFRRATLAHPSHNSLHKSD